LWFEGM